VHQKTHPNSIRYTTLILLSILLRIPSPVCAQTNLQNQDGYVRREGSDWILGTSRTEKRIRFADGHLSSISLRNKISGHEYQGASNPPSEVQFSADEQDVDAPTWHWKLLSEHAEKTVQGELQLDIELESTNLHVTKHYLIYPGTSVVREWLTIEGSSTKAVHLTKVDFLHRWRKISTSTI
jgi:hypothetical protein